jgi:hypothetical protein
MGAMWKKSRGVLILAAVPLTVFGVFAVLAGDPGIVLAGVLYVVVVPLILFACVAGFFLLGNSVDLVGRNWRYTRWLLVAAVLLLLVWLLADRAWAQSWPRSCPQPYTKTYSDDATLTFVVVGAMTSETSDQT